MLGRDAPTWDDATWRRSRTAGARPRRASSPSTRRPRSSAAPTASTGPRRVSGRFRFDALASSDYPAVGDWVALEPSAAAPGTEDRAVIAAVLPRRSAFVRSAADASRRTAGHLVDEQVIAANVDVAFLVAGLDHDFNLRRLERYLAVAWSSGVRRSSSSTRRTSRTTSTAASSRSRRSPRACRSSCSRR